MNQELDFKYLYDNYISLFETRSYSKVVRLGNKKEKICRFCNKSFPEVNFKMKAHAIPELLGNRKIFTYYECDECNEKFSRILENHLGIYLKPYRAVMQMRGKKGFPTYKSDDSRICTDEEGKLLVITSIDEPIGSLDEKNKKIIFKIKREPYVPVAVFKTFVKMALSIIPEQELPELKWAIRWINETEHSKAPFNVNPLFIQFTPGPKPYEMMDVFLFKKKEDSMENIPEYLFAITFGNFLFQIFLCALNEKNDQKNRKFILHYFPSKFGDDWAYGKTTRGNTDMSNNKFENEAVDTIEMSYEKAYKEL